MKCDIFINNSNATLGSPDLFLLICSTSDSASVMYEKLWKASRAKNAIFHDFAQKGFPVLSGGKVFDPPMIVWFKELFAVAFMPTDRNFEQERS